MAYLAVHIEGKETDRVPLIEQAILGRGEGCDVWIEDKKSSRKHCRVFIDNGFWTVEDLGSTNGTYIGRHAITRHALRDGETIRVGMAKIVFHQDDLSNAPGQRAPDPHGLSGSTLVDFTRPQHLQHLDRPLPTVAVSAEDAQITPPTNKPDHSIAFNRPPPTPIVPEEPEPAPRPSAMPSKKSWWRKLTGG